jgi:uncharacterized protein (TIGR02646 family)
MENEDWKPSWDELRAPEKPDVHEALLREQGFICCYCGMRINRKSSHIEHLKPRTTYPELALEYGNLLASCQGESEEPPLEPVHCGHKKGKWYEAHLMVSPLDANCANFFRYAGSGEILPTDEPDKQAVAITTIEKLGLDIDKLRAMRSAAIDGVLMAIEGLTDEEILLFVQAYEQLDADGRYTPFCDAIAYILKQYFIA